MNPCVKAWPIAAPKPVAGFVWIRVSLLPALLASASLMGLQVAKAQDTISTAITTPVATATANNGSPEDVTIASGGSITLSSTATGAAVQLNSANNVSNAGAITIDDANNIAGILVSPSGLSVANSGTISLTDSTPETTLGVNGSLTNGTARYGIWVSGQSAYGGGITESAGSISVLGNNSAAVRIDTGGMAGGLSLAGTTSLTGINGYGVQTLGLISGISNTVSGFNAGISVTDSLTAFGAGSSAISIGGQVTNGLYIDSTVQSNAYYSGAQDTSRPVSLPVGFAAKNEEIAGPGIIVGANVGGIELDSAAIVTSLGSSPAIVIGAPAAGSTTIGSGSTGYGLWINTDAVVTGNGIYDGISATAIQIGGSLASNTNPNAVVLGGGTTTISGGIDNLGTIKAIAYGANGNATAISFGAGAAGITLNNTGTISATAKLGYDSKSGGNATAILDTAGGLTSVTNSGLISAVAENAKASAIAFDLRSSDSAVTITQTASGTTTGSAIVGDVLFGNGNSGLNLNAGTLAGNVAFGTSLYAATATDSNALTLDNGAHLTGQVTEVNGALALDVADGRLLNTSATNLVLSSLKIGALGEIDFAIDPVNNQSGSLTVTSGQVGAVMISSGAKIGLDFVSKLTAPETFTLVQASGANAFAGSSPVLLGEVPYFYIANLNTDINGGAITVALSDRTFAQAGVQGNAAAYNAIFNAFDRDNGVFNSFNTAPNQSAFKRVYQQVLPAYSGGLFELLSEGSNTLVDAQANNAIVQRGDRSGAWAQQIGFGAEQNSSRAPGYYGGGLGFAFGWEDPATPISTIGYSVAYMRGSVTDENAGPNNQQVGTTYTAGVYWRETDGNFHAIASLNAGVAELSSMRNFAGTYADNTSFTRNATSQWSGGLGQAHLAVDYHQDLGDDFFIKPSIAGDYFVLYEGKHADHNGGSSLDLNYASTVGKQGSATGAVTVGTQWGQGFIWRPEVTVGYEEIFGGPDTTVSSFVSGGSSFSVSPPSQKSGPMAKIGIHGGNKYTDIAFEAGGEDRGDYKAVTGQLVARFNF